MKNIKELIRVRNLKVVREGDDGFLALWVDPVDRRTYSVVFSWGGGWEHLSVSPVKNDKTPSWELMCRFKDMFWNKDEVCIQYHPREQDYVNQMPHCLHIWKPIGIELPTPPPIMVGLRKE